MSLSNVRSYVIVCAWVSAAALLPACPKEPSSSDLVLVDRGTARYRILLQPEASPSEVRAASELQAHIEEATGVTLQVITWDPALYGDPSIPGVVEAETRAGGPFVVLGKGPVAEALGVAPRDEELGEQGYLLQAVPPHLVIAGTTRAGTLYGAHRFLREYLGVRWYAPGTTRVPAQATLRVPASASLLGRPAFLWRHTSYAWPGKDPAFLARQGDNAGDGGEDHPWGLQHAHDGRAHSYFRFVSPKELFDSHPEYFSEVGGVRLREETQLCLTNPNVLDIVTERMLARMADRPHVRQHNFSQEDTYNHCQCETCAAMNAEHGSAGATQFWFVSRLAERTSAVYPDKVIGTLAYMYTEEPPVDLEIHPSVAIWLCHMYPSCDSHPITTCPKNADYRRRAERWAELTGHLYIWHYVVDFTHYYAPFPNLRALADNLRFYRDLGVEGVYLQGMGHAGGGGEWSLLRPWFGMRLLDDPDQDPDALIADFLAGYYGAAAEPLGEYIDLLHRKVTDDQIHMHLYTNPAQGYLPDEVMSAAEALFDQAEAAVQSDPELLERVRVARMPLVYARFFPRNGYRIEDGRLRWNGEPLSFDELLEFLERMETHGFQTVREFAGDKETMTLLFPVLGSSSLGMRVIENAHLRVEVVPLLGGRALRIVDLASGEDVTAYDRRTSLYFPFAGGLEDRVGGLFENFGWVEPATVVDASGLGLVTRQETFNGFVLVRHLLLDAEEPLLHVSTTVTNPSGTAVATRLRSHLGLDLGALGESRLRFLSRDGQGVDTDMAPVLANQREGLHFYDQAAPQGLWTFSGPKGLEVHWSWDDSSGVVDYTWVYAYPESQQELEAELFAPRALVGPGESVTLTHVIEVRPAP